MRPYWDYAGLYWQLILLGQLHADGADPRIAKAVEFVLEHRHWVQTRRWQCLMANLLGALMRLGYTDHAIVIEETDALAERILNEDGIDCSEMGSSLLTRCRMALPKLLLCFVEVPLEQRSANVQQAIDRIVSDLLEQHVYIYLPGHRAEWAKIVAARPKRVELPEGERVVDWIAARRRQFLAERGLGEPRPKRGWLTFGFPLSYNSDILEALHALAQAGIPGDPQLEPALAVIREKEDLSGRWILERSLQEKMTVSIETLGAPSKWLTLRALHILKHFGGDDG